MVKLSFWFTEFRTAIDLLNSGKSMQEIKELSQKENIFAAPTEARANQIYCTISSRIACLDKSFYQLFEQSALSTQKLIALIAIMKADSLFFDFVYEVYREKLLIGTDEFVDRDIRIFFKDKRLQSEKVAKWTDYTQKRLGTCYKTMLSEAGIIDRNHGKRKILKPILDKALEQCLIANDMELFIHALTGVR